MSICINISGDDVEALELSLSLFLICIIFHNLFLFQIDLTFVDDKW